VGEETRFTVHHRVSSSTREGGGRNIGAGGGRTRGGGKSRGLLNNYPNAECEKRKRGDAQKK